MKRKVTAIIPSFNEEHNIRECIESVIWADEIIVVDSFSTDKTAEIAKELNVKLLQHEYKHSAAQKNWTIPQAENDWIFLLDSDERCTPGLQKEIETILDADEEPAHDGYWIYRRNFFIGKEIKHCGWNRDKVIRLFKKECTYEDVEVHAEIQLSAPAGVLNNKMLHYSYRTIEDFFTKLNRYTLWGAQKARTKGMKGNIFSIVTFSSWSFFAHYILRLGFLDGKAGLMISAMAGMSIFLRYAKIWELNQKK